MATYPVTIDGRSTLAEINAAIASEEAGASEFVDSQVSTRQGTPTNVATFDELAPGTIPPTLTMVTQGTAEPPDTSQVWSGVMLVEGRPESLVGYRKRA